MMKRYPRHATLDVTRTKLGYKAVLRIQGTDGSVIGLVGRCSDQEARTILYRAGGAGVGFSFRHMAKKIKHTASRVARSRVFKGLMKVAKLMPPPVSTTAVAAEGAARVLHGMRGGSHAARRAWDEAAGRARLQPHGSTAVGMRLAMQAVGRPRFVRGGGAQQARRDRTRAASSAFTDAVTAAVLEALRDSTSAEPAEPAAAPTPAPATAGDQEASSSSPETATA